MGLATLRANLRTLLIARPGLAGVDIFAFPPGEGVRPELIYFGRAPLTGESMAFGSPRAETIGIEGVIWVIRAGADDATATAAENRALAIWDEITAALIADPTVTGAVTVAEWTAVSFTPLADDRGRICFAEFTIEAGDYT